jgi:hypothetical protein
VTPPIEQLVPKTHAELHHRRRSIAHPDDLWAAAGSITLKDTPRLNRLIRWRLGRNAPPADTTFEDFFRSGVFTLLEEGERYSVSGVAGRIWSPSGDYQRFETVADYMDYDGRGIAKVVLANSVSAHDQGSEIVSEARIWLSDRRAQVIFRPFWAVVSPFARFIGSEGLAAAVRRAES